MQLTADTLYGFTKLYLWRRFDDPVDTPEFHTEVWEYACSSSKYVAIAAPRGHAKSTILTHCYALACLVFRINDHILIVSDTEAQAILFLGDIKRELIENDELILAFGIKRLIKDSETEIIVEFNDSHVARLLARGSEQKARGLKWRNKRPNLIIGDDLENDEMVENEQRRIKFRNWFFNALLNSGSRTCKVRIVGTILHFDSLLARLMPQETDQYTTSSSLSIKSSNLKRTWNSVLYRAHTDVDDFSEILWKEMWPEERLRLERQKYEEEGYLEGYSQEYLNNPIDESVSYFKRADFLPIELIQKDSKYKEPEEFYVGVDLAISERDQRAWSVFVIAGLNASSKLRVRNIIRDRMGGREIIDELFAIHTRYKPALIIIEDENISKALGGILNTEMIERHTFLNLHVERPVKDKVQRARALQARMRAGAVEFDKEADWYPILEQELLRFPRGKFSDQVDALAWICFALDNLIPAPTQEEVQEDEWLREYENTYPSGSYYNNEFDYEYPSNSTGY